VPQGLGPLSAQELGRLKAALCTTEPLRPPGQVAEHAPLGPLLVGWALEAVMQQPLDVLLQEWVVKPLLPKESLRFVRNGPQGPLVPPGAAVATAPCPWRHRTLMGEAHDKLAWLLGGVAGHSGAFASGDGLMRLCLGLLFSMQGVVRYAHGGTLQRFWSRGRAVAETPYTPGWMVACRANGMAPGRWHSRTVGQIDRNGSALFIDPAFGLAGVLLVNGDAEAPGAAEALAHTRQRVFDAMASYGQNLSAARK
jgi:CubicO group peptidase (beta-lactamase class C family)